MTTFYRDLSMVLDNDHDAYSHLVRIATDTITTVIDDLDEDEEPDFEDAYLTAIAKLADEIESWYIEMMDEAVTAINAAHVNWSELAANLVREQVFGNGTDAFRQMATDYLEDRWEDAVQQWKEERE